MANFLLSGFADEIAPDRHQQIATLKETGVGYLELRGIDGKGVLDLSAAEIDVLRSELDEAGIKVSAIGSPIGKVAIRSDLEEHFERFKVAVERAVQFDTPNIRVFSFYYKDEEPAACRDAVLAQFERMVSYSADNGCTLLHENEKGIYGDVPERCLDLVQSVDHANLRLIFDPANFIQCGVRAKDEAWPLLASHVVYFHIKDVEAVSGRVVPAGCGDAGVEEILRQAAGAGFVGFLSLEPHLKADDVDYGGSGVERFVIAVGALRGVLGRL
jgi:sugar phosphate isomerase/epimerase